MGFSSYAVKLLGAVACLEWYVQQGAAVEQGQAIGYVEASKATSDVYAPVSGVVVDVNARALADPALVNTNPYDAGWLVSIACQSVRLLAPVEYLAYLEATWPLAKRLLKGQAGRKELG